jgi:hypothetical protein
MPNCRAEPRGPSLEQTRVIQNATELLAHPNLLKVARPWAAIRYRRLDKSGFRWD